MRTSRFSRLLFGVFLAAAVIIVANAALAFRAEQVLADSERWVTHTLEILTDLERVLRTAYDAESSGRGYVLTGDESFLGGYYYAEDTLAVQFETLIALTSDNAPQQTRLEKARDLGLLRLERITHGVNLRKLNQLGGPDEARNRKASQAIMSQLNDTIQDAEIEERGLLGQRLRDTAGARRQAKITVVLASGFDVLFVAFSLWSLAHERRLRHRAAETASRLQKLQSVTEVAFSPLTVNELTAELLARLRGTAETDVLAMFRWYGNEVELIAAEGVPVAPGERRAVTENGALAMVARSGAPARLQGGDIERLPIEAMHSGLKVALILPMMIGPRVIAMLVAGRERTDRFSTDEEELLSLAADRIALALDRAEAYEAEREARRAAEGSAAHVQELNAVLEDRVRQRTSELENTNRELEAFSYSVSHDLRAPLRSVDGFSVALAEDYGHLLEGDGRHYLTRIRAGVQRMGGLIDSLLQLSRITRAELAPEHVHLSELAETVAADVAQGFADRPIRFAVEPHLETKGDPRLLRVVFENMFGNAAKFTGKTDRPEVSFGWSPDRNAYFVRDNGAGFDQQYAGKLFVAFQRLHGDKDFQGSGIGLATVARVIARHHGSIWAEGEVGKGATFWFTLN